MNNHKTVVKVLAEETIETLNKSVDWLINDVPASGDDYDAIHREVVKRVVSLMLDNLNEVKTYKSL